MNRTRVGLLRGAAGAFAASGFRRTTMQSIAATAGVAKGTLYNHFRTKGEVAEALLDAELRRLAELAAAVPRDRALLLLAEEIATHPVLRRLATSEPDVLAELLGAASEPWTEVTAALGGVLDTDDVTAGLVARWLVGVALQPGEAGDRRAQARRLGAVLVPEPGVGGIL